MEKLKKDGGQSNANKQELTELKITIKEKQDKIVSQNKQLTDFKNQVSKMKNEIKELSGLKGLKEQYQC